MQLKHSAVCHGPFARCLASEDVKQVNIRRVFASHLKHQGKEVVLHALRHVELHATDEHQLAVFRQFVTDDGFQLEGMHSQGRHRFRGLLDVLGAPVELLLQETLLHVVLVFFRADLLVVAARIVSGDEGAAGCGVALLPKAVHLPDLPLVSDANMGSEEHDDVAIFRNVGTEGAPARLPNEGWATDAAQWEALPQNSFKESDSWPF